MTGRIITLRHGRPDLSRKQKLTAAEYGRWWRRYDETGLAEGEYAPVPVKEMASAASGVFSSTLPRAMDTAARATGSRTGFVTDALFVEAPLPSPPVPFLRLRPGVWGVIARIAWLAGYAPDGMESHFAARQRVRRITACLAGRATESGGDIFLCAHGYLNWMIDRRLRKEGWVLSAHHGRNRYWSWRLYEKSSLPEKVEVSDYSR